MGVHRNPSVAFPREKAIPDILRESKTEKYWGRRRCAKPKWGHQKPVKMKSQAVAGAVPPPWWWWLPNYFCRSVKLSGIAVPHIYLEVMHVDVRVLLSCTGH